jgi:uncharacterized protein (TIGR03790 family)
MNPRRGATAALLMLASLAPAAVALGPENVYLVVNKNVADSQGIADHYCEKRGVPKDHVIVLDLPSGEDISRTDYDAKLAGPLRDKIRDKKDKVKVLLTVYGVPLRVGGQEPNADEKAELDTIRKDLEPVEKQRKDLDEEIKGLEAKAKDDPKGQAADDLKIRRKARLDLDGPINLLVQKRRFLSHDESYAAVDSELALLWHDAYELRRWQLNLLYFQVPEDVRKEKPPMQMTCRLDGPSVELVKRIIDQSVEVEAKGLEGKVYVDARGIQYNPADDPGLGYGGYDESMREMARLLEKEGKMSVTLDDKPELFAADSCPECALYCGWYSLANYVPCCKFVPGAVAWHLASSEAVSLRDPKSKLWCKNLLENGAVATLGPVGEPYTVGFPKPAEFFGTLVTGQYTLVESYWRTEMFASWMTVLVGDPLYNPYAKSPRLKVEQVKPSPAGGRFPFVKAKKEGK